METKMSSRRTKTSFVKKSRSKSITKGVVSMTSNALRAFDKKGLTNFSKLLGHVASTMLTAYLGFKDPKRRRREYLIPKDRAAWLEWMVTVAKKRINVEYLTDKELRKVIIRARPNLSPHKKHQGPVFDPDLPSCLSWDEVQVGEWIASIGWPQLKETFTKNMVTGRRLVLIDCAALNKMGMTDLPSMRDVAGKIRELLGIPPPNGIRPIMRIPPFERFLRRKVYNGRSYDEMTFEKFCEVEGYNYDLIQNNKNTQIPCTCEVLITTPDRAEDDEGDGENKDDEISLQNAPTVEYIVRNALIRNKTVDSIMADILESVFLPPEDRMYGRDLYDKMKRGIGEGYDGHGDRMEFVTAVANSIVNELNRTVEIMNDIETLQKHIKHDISKEDIKMFRHASKIMMEEAAPIAALMALGELDLESIFRQEPEFNDFVDGIIEQAENTINNSEYVDNNADMTVTEINK